MSIAPMSPASGPSRLRRSLAVMALAAVLAALGLGAMRWSFHAHDDHGWHAHAGRPVPEAPPEDLGEGAREDDHGHGLSAATAELVAPLPPTRGPVAPHPADLPVAAAVAADASRLVPSSASLLRPGAWWHPPPPWTGAAIAQSGTARVLRTSHALLF